MKNGFELDQSILLDGLFPRRCVFCATKLNGGWWCASCADDLPKINCQCPSCGIPLSSTRTCGRCQTRRPQFDLTIAPLTYATPLTGLIHRFKYRAQLALTEPLAELFLATARLPGLAPEALIPVPLHPNRLRRRGYNQAAELARAIANRLDLPTADHLALRKQATTAQADLPLAQRSSNVRGVFAVHKPMPCSRMAIVDDVMTSGATVNELARMLRAAGAEWIEVWVLCRA